MEGDFEVRMPLLKVLGILQKDLFHSDIAENNLVILKENYPKLFSKYLHKIEIMFDISLQNTPKTLNEIVDIILEKNKIK